MPQSKEFFIDKFRRTSPVLRWLDPQLYEEVAAAGKLTGYICFTLSDAEGYLRDLLNKGTDYSGYPQGFLPAARLELKKALDEFHRVADEMNATRPADKKITKPEQIHRDIAERINKAKARDLVLSEESRALTKAIDQADAQDRKSVFRNTRKGIGKKNPDGTYNLLDGREVKNNKFVDDGSDVLKYIENFKAETIAKAKIDKQKWLEINAANEAKSLRLL